ncbi:MAG: N-acetyl-gamma-glutamyl-phosphate reductase [Eggerthellaceae bacterium]|nr:N-acetyl-gamma-glutamyl-phosphate reductase [Eggerthellaceae bacterium]
MSIKVGIVGASGFTGAELMRLILAHPDFELSVATSGSEEGRTVASVVPSFTGRSQLRFSSHDDPALFDCEALFLAVPHTASLALTPKFISRGISVFDLSADYRLKDPKVYEEWYASSHSSPELLATAVFGLPEIFRSEILDAQAQHAQGKAVLVACAGCYPTASSLAAYPALAAGIAQGPVVISAISGVSGAGKAATQRTHFCFANENLEAYNVGRHRHTPEIEQILGLAGGVIFSPHLAPLNRGLLSTVHLPLTAAGADKSLEAIHESYCDFYRKAPFVKVLDKGGLPRTASVTGSNCAHIGLALLETTKTLVVVAAIDNLCKGASGQALQCANIIFGLAEESGLSADALYV